MQSKDFEKMFSINLADINYDAFSPVDTPNPKFFPVRTKLLKTPVDACADTMILLAPAPPETIKFFIAAHRIMHQVEDNFPSKN